jgi:hypothetical protein
MTKHDHGRHDNKTNKKTQFTDKVKTILYDIGNYLILSVPLLAEIRLGSSRALSFIKIWHYLARAEIKGDYLEFGVWRGALR